jgi:hypothetical protein
MKIWTCGSSQRSGSRKRECVSKTSTVPFVGATFGIFFVWRDPNDFLSRLVNMDETWLYHYDLETKQPPMEFVRCGGCNIIDFYNCSCQGDIKFMFW